MQLRYYSKIECKKKGEEMKKIMVFLLVGFLLIFFTGCTNDTIVDDSVEDEVIHNDVEMNVRIKEVEKTELLGRAVNSDQFDMMRINIEGIKLDFTPASGQVVHVKIKDQVGKSQPPYTIAVEMILID